MTSSNLTVYPAGTNPLADNVNDLRPRNHIYVSSGTGSLAVNFACDTSLLADGYHQLAAVAYEGTSVATQTRVTRNVQIQNTGLTAAMSALPTGTNAGLNQLLQFTITANTTNIASIELFSTGGSQGVVANQSTAVFTIPAADLGLGAHPFYALVTDQGGHRFQTATIYYQIVPAIDLSLSPALALLTWTATTNRQYDLQFTTNLTSAFQTVATIIASNPIVQWPVSLTNRAGFYRVKLDP
jgi:hypothetical protein